MSWLFWKFARLCSYYSYNYFYYFLLFLNYIYWLSNLVLKSAFFLFLFLSMFRCFRIIFQIMLKKLLGLAATIFIFIDFHFQIFFLIHSNLVFRILSENTAAIRILTVFPHLKKGFLVISNLVSWLFLKFARLCNYYYYNYLYYFLLFLNYIHWLFHFVLTSATFLLFVLSMFRCFQIIFLIMLKNY